VGHRDVEVDPVPLRPRAVHLLKPDGRKLPGRIDDGVLAAVAAGFVGIAQHCFPERPDRGYVHRVNGQLQHLDRPQ
jgi:hypothetical protein